MSIRERRLKECYDSALFGIEQAIDALDKAGSNLLKTNAEHLHQKVLTLRKTMFYPYPGDTNDKRSHENWNGWIPASNPPAEGNPETAKRRNVMNEQLLPCPFCGEQPFITAAQSAHCNIRVCCTGCTAVVHSASSTSAIKQWNDRYFPEGCTPEDAIKLREANHALAAEKDTFESLLTTAMELIREQGLEDAFFIRRGELNK